MNLIKDLPRWLRAPRNSLFILLTIVLLVAVALVSRAQLPVVLYKSALISLAAVLGYWLDRVIFPYARPSSYLHDKDWRASGADHDGSADYKVCNLYRKEFMVAQLRRAAVMGAVILGVAMGL